MGEGKGFDNGALSVVVYIRIDIASSPRLFLAAFFFLFFVLESALSCELVVVFGWRCLVVDIDIDSICIFMYYLLSTCM
jgi:hypothetical protein